jgi:hypothetical protein
LDISDELAFSSSVAGTAEEGRRVEDVWDFAGVVDAAVGSGGDDGVLVKTEKAVAPG